MKDTRKISTLKLWDKNPRSIGKGEYKSLKKKIERWGQFKPVLITENGTVIGGNMRIRAYRDLKIKDVWVSVVKPKNESEMIEMALADNELAGRWDEQALAELIEPLKINLKDYKLDLNKAKDLKEILEDYMTINEKEFDENIKTDNKCPKCNYEW